MPGAWRSDRRPHRQSGPGDARATGAAVLVVLLGLVLTGLLSDGFSRTTEDAVDTLMVQRAEQVTAGATTHTLAARVLLQGLQGLVEAGTTDDELVARFVRSAAAGTGAGNALPGVDQALLLTREGDRIAVTRAVTIGTGRSLPEMVPADSAVLRGLERATRTPLPVFAEMDLAPDTDVLLVLWAPGAGDAEERWVALVVDRGYLLERSLRGSGLVLEVADATPGRSEPARPPLTVRDIDTTEVAEPGARTHRTLLTVADETWELTFTALPSFADDLPVTRTSVVVAIGAALSLLAGALLWTLVTGRARAQGEARTATAALTASERQFRSLATASPVGIAATDAQGRLRYANRRLLDLLDLDDQQAALGQPLWIWVHPDEREHARTVLDTDQLPDDGVHTLDCRLDLPVRRHVAIRLAPVTDADDELDGWAGSVADVTPEVLAREELQREEARHRELATRYAHEASHDPLTGLPNRRQLIDRLDETSREAGPGQVVLALLDLDGFKEVNDTLGHPVGDRLLVAVARRIAACVRNGDLGARLGGDEFALLLSPVTVPTAEEVATRVLGALEQPFELEGTAISISASIGLASNDPGWGGDDLLREADVAMYAAKRAGKGRWVWSAGQGSSSIMTVTSEPQP